MLFCRNKFFVLYSEKGGGSLLNAIRQRKQRTLDIQEVVDEEHLEEVCFSSANELLYNLTAALI